jgi:hypothetical protein
MISLDTTTQQTNPAQPGSELILHGSGFAAGSTVHYISDQWSMADAMATVVNATEIRSTIPDVLAGSAGSVWVSVSSPDGQTSGRLSIDLAETAAVEFVRLLASRSTVKAMLGIAASETFDDAKLDALIRAASVQVASECQRKFDLVNYVELYDGDGTPSLMLRHAPVAAVNSVLIDGAAAPLEEISIGSGWIRFEDTGDYNPRTRASMRVFSRGVRNIQVDYQAGYALIPADINLACQMQCAFLYTQITKQGLVSEGNSNAGVTTAYLNEPLTPAAKRICMRYKTTKLGVIG